MKQEKKLEEAKRLYQTANADQRYVLESLFPELKESEDEKNVKDLIDELKCSLRAANCQNEACNGGHEKRIALLEWAIAWVEKQVKLNVETTFQVWKDMRLEVFAQASGNRHESNCSDECTKMFSLCDIDEIILNITEKQGEKKSADKVEPKFHVRDWVVTDKGYTVQIAAVNSCYTINNGMDFSTSYVDKYWRLWTIKDAKPGDALAWDDNKCIALFQNIYDEHSFNSYGCVGHCTGTFEAGLSYHDIKGAHPATNEQRAILFQKMEEAGYKWDDESKQLLSLKVEPTREIRGNNGKISPKWTEEDEEEFKIAIETLYEAGQHSSAMWLKSIKQRIVQ